MVIGIGVHARGGRQHDEIDAAFVQPRQIHQSVGMAIQQVSRPQERVAVKVRDPERIVERLRHGRHRLRPFHRAVEHAIDRVHEKHCDDDQQANDDERSKETKKHWGQSVGRSGQKRNESKPPNYRDAESLIRGSCGNRWLSNSVKSPGARAGEGLLSFAQNCRRGQQRLSTR
jgi:hypothetical protein